jgi:Uma2 family endonuclease
MGATTRVTFEDFLKIPEREGTIYELDEGNLVMEPSPVLRHNLIRQRIATELRQFVESRNLGIVIEEMDFRLGVDTVRNPDAAFVTAEHLRHSDPDRSPAEGAPALAVEVISLSNRTEDTAKKIQQYLKAGSRSVWIVHPKLRLIEIHTRTGAHTIREPELLKDQGLFPGFSMELAKVFGVIG